MLEAKTVKEKLWAEADRSRKDEVWMVAAGRTDGKEAMMVASRIV